MKAQIFLLFQLIIFSFGAQTSELENNDQNNDQIEVCETNNATKTNTTVNAVANITNLNNKTVESTVVSTTKTKFAAKQNPLSLEIPSPVLPDIQLPRIPSVEKPSVKKSLFSSLNIPSLEIPNISSPKIATPALPDIPLRQIIARNKSSHFNINEIQKPKISYPALPNIAMPLIQSLEKPKFKEIIKSPDLPDLRTVRLRSKPTINLRNISSLEIPSLLKPDIPSPEIPDVVEPTVDKISSPVIPEISSFEIPVIPSPENSLSLNSLEIPLPINPIESSPDIPSPVIIPSDKLNKGNISLPELPIQEKPFIQSPQTPSVANPIVDRISTNISSPVISSLKISFPSKYVEQSPNVTLPVFPLNIGNNLNIGNISLPEIPVLEKPSPETVSVANPTINKISTKFSTPVILKSSFPEISPIDTPVMLTPDASSSATINSSKIKLSLKPLKPSIDIPSPGVPSLASESLNIRNISLPVIPILEKPFIESPVTVSVGNLTVDKISTNVSSPVIQNISLPVISSPDTPVIPSLETPSSPSINSPQIPFASKLTANISSSTEPNFEILETCEKNKTIENIIENVLQTSINATNKIDIPSTTNISTPVIPNISLPNIFSPAIPDIPSPKIQSLVIPTVDKTDEQSIKIPSPALPAVNHSKIPSLIKPTINTKEVSPPEIPSLTGPLLDKPDVLAPEISSPIKPVISLPEKQLDTKTNIPSPKIASPVIPSLNKLTVDKTQSNVLLPKIPNILSPQMPSPTPPTTLDLRVVHSPKIPSLGILNISSPRIPSLDKEIARRSRLPTSAKPNVKKISSPVLPIIPLPRIESSGKPPPNIKTVPSLGISSATKSRFDEMSNQSMKIPSSKISVIQSQQTQFSSRSTFNMSPISLPRIPSLEIPGFPNILPQSLPNIQSPAFGSRPKHTFNMRAVSLPDISAPVLPIIQSPRIPGLIKPIISLSGIQSLAKPTKPLCPTVVIKPVDIKENMNDLSNSLSKYSISVKGYKLDIESLVKDIRSLLDQKYFVNNNLLITQINELVRKNDSRLKTKEIAINTLKNSTAVNELVSGFKYESPVCESTSSMAQLITNKSIDKSILLANLNNQNFRQKLINNLNIISN